MKSKTHDTLVANLPIGYGLHKIVVDSTNKPIDYVFLDVNKYFETYTGLKKEDIIGKSILEVIPDIKKDEFNWIEYYGNIAFNGETADFIQYSAPLNRSYKVHVYSPEPHYFVTLFTDQTIEEEREKVLHNIVQLAPIPIMIHAEDGEVVHVSDAWLEISGYEHKDIPTIWEWTKKAYGVEQKSAINVIDKLYDLKERQYDGEFTVRAKDGTTLLWDFYSTYLGKLQDGRRIAMSVALDITHRHELEEQLKKETQLMETTLLSVGDGVITTDKNGLITLLSTVAEQLTGWTSEEALGKNVDEVFDIFNEYTKEKAVNIVRQVIEEKKTANLANSTMLRSKDGTIRPIADSAAPIINEQNDVIGAVLVFRDYTEKYEHQKQQQQLLDELTQTKILLQSSLNSPKNMIIISLDQNYCYLYFNEAHRISMKESYQADVKLGDCIFDFLSSEEEIDTLKHDYDIALAGNSHQRIDVFGDIDPSYYSIKYNPIKTADNDVIGITVFAEDITEQIQMQQKVAYQEEIANLYFDITNQLLVVLNEDANIELINDAGCALLEDTRENIIGLNWFENFIPSGINKKVMDVFNSVFETGFDNYSTYTNEIVSAKGRVKTIAWKNTLLRDINGNVTSVIACGEDITAQINHEKELIRISNTDALTGLYNRRYYEKAVREFDNKENLPLSIIISDINGLKLINDAFGHDSGDELLIQTSIILQESIPDRAVVSRIGGDEFAILLPNTKQHQAEKIVHMINTKAAKTEIKGVPLSISSGIDTKTKDLQDFRQTVRSAEDKMYRTKLLEIPSMRSSTIETILATLHEKDQYSRTHSQNVANYCKEFAIVLNLTAAETKELFTVGLLHDIGKIIIPDTLLNKQGKFTETEYDEIKKHSEIGFRILNSTKNLRDISSIVLHHHEWWNGKGYPQGVTGEDIPYYSRILCIADAFDAMTSDRTYRKKYSTSKALSELQKYAGIQFDPNLVPIFIEHIEEIIQN